MNVHDDLHTDLTGDDLTVIYTVLSDLYDVVVLADDVPATDRLYKILSKIAAVLPDTELNEDDVWVADLHDRTARCPECAIDGGMPRQQAFDMHFGPWRDNRLPRRNIVGTRVVNPADPTQVEDLSCGHTIM